MDVTKKYTSDYKKCLRDIIVYLLKHIDDEPKSHGRHIDTIYESVYVPISVSMMSISETLFNVKIVIKVTDGFFISYIVNPIIKEVKVIPLLKIIEDAEINEISIDIILRTLKIERLHYIYCKYTD